MDLDTLVGLIPFVDHDTAAMVYPVDRYTELLFKGSSPVDTQQLRRYAFANVRFVPPKSIQVLQPLDESEMPTPDSLADMTPADWAQLSLIVHGEAALGADRAVVEDARQHEGHAGVHAGIPQHAAHGPHDGGRSMR